MSESNTESEVDEWYKSDLVEIGREVDLSGRSKMSKEELYEELDDKYPDMLEPWGCVSELEEGDEVSMNHLSGNLEVTEVSEEEKWIGVVMVTSRGGRHMLVVPKNGFEVGKNGEDPHLKRWRAGDKEWMNNSTDPVFIRKIEEESEENEGDDDD